LLKALINIGNDAIWVLSKRERRHALRDLQEAVGLMEHRCDAGAMARVTQELSELAGRMSDKLAYKNEIKQKLNMQRYYRETDIFEIVRDRMKVARE
jgi:hypothetical protein